ncbi:hypothetical protein HOH87_05425 [bacterium]|nr:hypothetical protein [bacterium]
MNIYTIGELFLYFIIKDRDKSAKSIVLLVCVAVIYSFLVVNYLLNGDYSALLMGSVLMGFLYPVVIFISKKFFER